MKSRDTCQHAQSTPKTDRWEEPIVGQVPSLLTDTLVSRHTASTNTKQSVTLAPGGVW